MTNLAKSQPKIHNGEGSQEVLFVSLLSEGHQRGEERCHLSRGQLVMSVRALFVLYGQYVRLYQLDPLCLIYNSIVCGKSGPVFTIQDTIKFF